MFRKYGFVLLLLAVIFYPFVFFSSENASNRQSTVAERVLAKLTEPVNAVFAFLSRDVRGAWESYISLVDAKDEVEKLRQVNSENAVKFQILKELETENKRLKQLLGFVESAESKFVAGKILSADPSFLYRSVRINRGDKDGISTGMSVVSAEGVVGIVMRTSSSYSDILLILDPNCEIDVLVTRNRRRGILQGGQGKTLRFKYADRGSKVQVGDEITTSGLTGSFPRGILVGKVTKVLLEGDGVSQVVEVEPSVDFSLLSEAVVILKPSNELEVIRKMGGNEWLGQFIEAGKSGSP